MSSAPDASCLRRTTISARSETTATRASLPRGRVSFLALPSLLASLTVSPAAAPVRQAPPPAAASTSHSHDYTSRFGSASNLNLSVVPEGYIEAAPMQATRLDGRKIVLRRRQKIEGWKTLSVSKVRRSGSPLESRHHSRGAHPLWSLVSLRRRRKPPRSSSSRRACSTSLTTSSCAASSRTPLC